MKTNKLMIITLFLISCVEVEETNTQEELLIQEVSIQEFNQKESGEYLIKGYVSKAENCDGIRNRINIIVTDERMNFRDEEILGELQPGETRLKLDCDNNQYLDQNQYYEFQVMKEQIRNIIIEYKQIEEQVLIEGIVEPEI